MPSGVGPTVRVSTTRGGFAFRSITLTVSASPGCGRCSPRRRSGRRRAMSSRRAAGRRRSRACCSSTLVPSTEHRDHVSPSRVTSAVLPSGANDVARSRFVVAERHLAGRRHRLALDREHRHRAFAAVGDQRQRALPVERDAGGARTGLERRNDLRWRRLRGRSPRACRGTSWWHRRDRPCSSASPARSIRPAPPPRSAAARRRWPAPSISATTFGGQTLEVDHRHGVGRRFRQRP